MQVDTATGTVELPSKPPRRSAPRTPEFPGCRPVTITREDIATWEGRFEYWDGDTETAWVVSEPTSATHEQPGARLAGLSHVIAGVRGAPIECYGTMDLLLRDERGEKRRIMQADQSVYLHPWRARLPTDAMEIGRHDRPDVVLEVDPHHRRAPGQALAVRGVGLPRGMGGRAGGGVRGEASRRSVAGG